MRTPPPKPPKGGYRRKKLTNNRTFRVSRVNLGDGQLVTVRVTVGKEGVNVRQIHSRSKWSVSLADMAGSVARLAQRRMIEMRLGTSNETA